MEVQTSLAGNSQDWLSRNPVASGFAILGLVFALGVAAGSTWANWSALYAIEGNYHWQLHNIIRTDTPAVGTKPKGCP